MPLVSNKWFRSYSSLAKLCYCESLLVCDPQSLVYDAAQFFL